MVTSYAQNARMMDTFHLTAIASSMIAADTLHVRMQMDHPLLTRKSAACALAPCICIKEAVTHVEVFILEASFVKNAKTAFVPPAHPTSFKTLQRPKRLTRAFDVMIPWVSLDLQV